MKMINIKIKMLKIMMMKTMMKMTVPIYPWAGCNRCSRRYNRVSISSGL